MACIQLLKSSPSDFQTKFGCFFLQFRAKASVKRSLRFQNSGIVFDSRRLRVCCKVEENDTQNSRSPLVFDSVKYAKKIMMQGEEPPESLFMKELKRRGMSSTSLLEEKNRSTDRDEETKFREEDGGWSYSRRNGVITGDERNLSNQREKSMALNSEGLEGLIPRAQLLLTLGGTFFLAFWPLIIATVASFCALYLFFGPEFVHDGSDTWLPPSQYINPYALLGEERIYGSAPVLN